MSERLLAEQDTPEIDARVFDAACLALGVDVSELRTVFEHGQWWVVSEISGAQWSVCDAEGPGSVDGFSFEQVTEADE